MDEDDVRETNKLENNDNTFEKTLENALDVNDTFDRKEKTFKTTKKFTTPHPTVGLFFLPNQRLFKTTALPLSTYQHRFTTLKPESTTEADESNEQTKTLYSLKNPSKTLKPGYTTPTNEVKQHESNTTRYKYTRLQLMSDATRTSVVNKSTSLMDPASISTTENILESDQETEASIAQDYGSEDEESTLKIEESSTISDIKTIDLNKVDIGSEQYNVGEKYTTERDQSPTTLTEKALSAVVAEKNVIKETNAAPTLNIDFDETTITPREFFGKVDVESVTETVTHKTFTRMNRPLIRTTTSKPLEKETATDATARKLFTSYNHLRITTPNEVDAEHTEYKLKEQTTAKSAFESSTRRSVFLKNRKTFNSSDLFKVTTSRNIDDLPENEFKDQTTENTLTTTENSSSVDATTKRPYSRLIRYRTTTPPNDEIEEDKELQEIETSTRRSVGIQKASTLTPGRSFGGIDRFKMSRTEAKTKQENTADERINENATLPARRYFKGLSQSKTSVTESSFGYNIHKVTSDATTDESMSTRDNESLASIKKEASHKSTLLNWTIFEGLTTTENTVENLDNTAEVENQTSNIEKSSTESALPMKSTFENLARPTIFTPENTKVATDNIRENNEYGFSTDGNIYSTTEVTDEKTETTMKNYEENNTPNSDFEDDAIPTISPVFTASEMDNRMENNEDRSSKVSTEKPLSIRVPIDNTITKRKPIVGFNRSETATIQDTTQIIDNAVTRFKSLGSYGKVVDKHNLTTRKPFGSFTQVTTSTTQPEVEKAGSTLENDKDNTRNEEVTKKVILHSRLPFGGSTPSKNLLQRFGSFGRIKLEEPTTETVEKAKGSRKFALQSRKPFGGFIRPTTFTSKNIDKDGDGITEDSEEPSTTEDTMTTTLFEDFSPTTEVSAESSESTLQTNEESTMYSKDHPDGIVYTTGTIDGLNRTAFTESAIEEITVENNEDILSKVFTDEPLSTKTPNDSFIDSTTTETATEFFDSTIKDDNKILFNIEIMTERTPPSTTTAQVTIEKTETSTENVEGHIKKEEVTISSQSGRSFRENKLKANEFYSTLKGDNENIAQKIYSRKFTLPTRRPFSALTRPTTSATTKDTDNTTGVKKEIPAKKYTLLTRKPFGFTRPTTTESYNEGTTTENLLKEHDTISSKQTINSTEIFQTSTLKATTETADLPEIFTENKGLYTTELESTEEQYESSVESMLQDELQTNTAAVNDNSQLITTEEVFQTGTNTPKLLEETSPEAVSEIHTPISTEEQRNNNEQVISQSGSIGTTAYETATLNVNSQTNEKKKSTDNNITEKAYKTAKLNLASSHMPRNITGIRPILNITDVPITSEEEYENSNEMTTTRPVIIHNSSAEDLFDETTTEAPDPATDEEKEDQTTDKATPKLFSKLNPVQTSTQSTSKIRQEESVSKSNRLRSTTESSLIEHNANAKKSFSRLNKFRPVTKFSRIKDLNDENEENDYKDFVEISTQRYINTISQRLNANARPQAENTKQGAGLNNQNVFYQNNGQTKPRLSDKKVAITGFNFKKPEFKRPLLDSLQGEEEDENSFIFNEEYDDREDEINLENKHKLASHELALKKRTRHKLVKPQDNYSDKKPVNDRLKNLLTPRTRTQTTEHNLISKSSELTTEDSVGEMAITTAFTNSKRFGTTNPSNSTVANYLNKIKNNLSQTITNPATSHIKQDNENKLKIDTAEVAKGDDEDRAEDSNSNKYNVNEYNNNVNKGYDNDFKRRFQKYQFQRRTTTTSTTTTTTARPAADNGSNDAIKTQVNFNDANESERKTSTNIPDTSAPITTESPSSPATPRRIKVIKLKRPVVSSSNNTNTTITANANANASSATNLNASHTETQNIVRLSSVDKVLVDSQVARTQILTETQITKTQTIIPPQTSPTPKNTARKVIIRKLVRPVNRTAESANETNNEKSKETPTTSSPSRQNANRFGFNRSTKFETPAKESSYADVSKKSSKETENDVEIAAKRKIELLRNRGRNRFTLLNEAASTTSSPAIGTASRRGYSNRQRPLTTTEDSVTSEDNGDDEDYVSEEDDSEEIELKQTKAPKSLNNAVYTTINRFRSNTTTSNAVTESSVEIVEQENGSGLSTELEITTDNAENTSSTKILDQSSEEEEQEFSHIKNEEHESKDYLLKLHNNDKQDLVKEDQEGVEKNIEDDDPLQKLRNKIKQNLAKSNQSDGILNDGLKLAPTESVVEYNDNPLLKLRNKVKQELNKSDHEEGVINVKLKQLLETKNTTAVLNYRVEDIENESTSTKDSLSLQKIREKVQTNLSKNDQDQGVVNSKLKKLLSEKHSSTTSTYNGVEDGNEHDTTTDLKDDTGDGDRDLFQTSKSFSPEINFTPETKPTPLDNEQQTETEPINVATASVSRGNPTFRRKLIAKRPYVPTKSSLSASSSTTVKTPTTNSKNKYVRRKFGRFEPLNVANRNTAEDFVQTDARANNFPATARSKIEGSAGSQNDKGEAHEDDHEEEAEVDSNDDTKSYKLIEVVKPNVNKPPGNFNRHRSTILKKPTIFSKEHGSGDEEGVDDDVDDEDEDDEDSDEEDEEGEEDNSEKEDFNISTYKPKENRIVPGTKPALTTTPTIKKTFTPSRVANTPYKTGEVTASTSSNKANRFSSTFKSTPKTRVINRPLVPNLTIKHVANDFERTTLLIPTKPAPFINPNTRAYERKYTGPTTEASADTNNDNNALIEDLNIEALNARNKKIFDINSKKHTALKPKVFTPLSKLNENLQEPQEQTNREFENDENYYQTSKDGFATTTTTTTLNTNTQQQQQEHEQSTTLDNTLVGTQNTDDANKSNVNTPYEIFSQDGFTTTPPPSTTLLHIFTLSDAEHTTPNPYDDAYRLIPRLIVERVKPKHKVVEINRIVEVNSKEEKLRRKSKANTIVTVEGSQTYKVESLPHVEQLGEISVVKYVHQVDGSDITIEGRSTVTDYTPTEQPVPGASQPVPVRNSLPEASIEERSGKALVPEILRESVETSTISLEGLFENARKSKVLNIVDDVDFMTKEIYNSKPNDVQTMPETTNEKSNQFHDELKTQTSDTDQSSTQGVDLLKSIAFDTVKINLEPNSQETEANNENTLELASPTATTLASSSSTTTPASKQEREASIVSPTPEILTVESTTVVQEDKKASTVAAALFPHYLRTPATANNNGLTVTRRPVLSVRRRLVNSSTAATAANIQQTTTSSLTTLPDSSSNINDEYITTSKFKRLRTNRPPTLNSAAVDITTDTTAATSFKTNNKLNKKSTETSSNDLKLASSSLTSASSADNDITAKQLSKAQSSIALRRKFQTRRLTTNTPSNTNNDGTATEPPRTQNPLFKRRYGLTTYSPLSVKGGQPSKTATTTISSSQSSTLRTAIDSLTTTVYVDGLENEEATDQVAKSSIHTSRFNQINSRLHTDDDDVDELEAGKGGVKSLTTLASATKPPATRFLNLQSQQQQPYSKYNYDDVITRRMDGSGFVAKSSTGTTITAISSTATSTQAPAIKKRKMIIKRRPQKTTPSSEESLASKRRRPHKYQEPFERINSSQAKSVKTSTQPGRTYRPNLDYDYYDDEDVRLVGNKSDQQLKVILHGGGIIECLDQGNFPHPLSCRKFISCAKFETGGVVGWEYTCPKGLSYDPVGGMCNWAAGLGCKE